MLVWICYSLNAISCKSKVLYARLLTGLSQWWLHSPSTNEARVRFLTWCIMWFELVLYSTQLHSAWTGFNDSPVFCSQIWTFHFIWYSLICSLSENLFVEDISIGNLLDCHLSFQISSQFLTNDYSKMEVDTQAIAELVPIAFLIAVANGLVLVLFARRKHLCTAPNYILLS